MVIQPGDVLLYRPSGVYGRIIMIKTWHAIGHVEVSLGDGTSVASRDGKGVDRYEHRSKDLAIVLRPRQPIDIQAGMRWFDTVKGTPYGWLDLLQFIGVNVDAKGIVCSPFATLFLRACGLPIFNDEPALKIAPFQFALAESLMRVDAEPV